MPTTLSRALLVGLALALASLFVALLFAGPKNGYPDNPDRWPPEARMVIAERPGQPLTEEQWSRINRVLNASGSRESLRRGFLAELVGAWYLLLALPVTAAVAVLSLQRERAVLHAVAFAAPSVLLLACLFAASRL